MKRMIKQIMLVSALFMGAAVQAMYPLHDAAKRGNLEEVRIGIMTHAIDSLEYEGRTALYMAAREGHRAVVEFLTSMGANVNAESTLGKTPLYMAALKGHFEVVQFLVKHGAAVNVLNIHGETPLHGALERGHLTIVKYLISHGAFCGDNDKTDFAELSEPVLKACFTLGALYHNCPDAYGMPNPRDRIKTMPARELWNLLADAMTYDCTAAEKFIHGELAYRQKAVERRTDRLHSRCLEINELIANAQKNGKEVKLDEQETKKLRLHKDTALLALSFLPEYAHVDEWERGEQVLRESFAKTVDAMNLT